MKTISFPNDYINNTPYNILLFCAIILTVIGVFTVFVSIISITIGPDPFQSQNSFKREQKWKLILASTNCVLLLVTLANLVLVPHYPIVNKDSLIIQCADKDFTCELDKEHVRANDPKEWKDNITVKKNGADYSITAVAHEDGHTIMVVEKQN